MRMVTWLYTTFLSTRLRRCLTAFLAATLGVLAGWLISRMTVQWAQATAVVVPVVVVGLGTYVWLASRRSAEPKQEPLGGRLVAIPTPWPDSTRMRAVVLVVVVGIVVFGALLVIATLGTRDILSSVEKHGSLGPSDAPALIGTITALSTAVGVLIGAGCLGLSRLWRARGAKDRDHGEGARARGEGEAAMMRARAEILRAEADLIRAQQGLPALPPAPSEPDSSSNY